MTSTPTWRIHTLAALLSLSHGIVQVARAQCPAGNRMLQGIGVLPDYIYGYAPVAMKAARDILTAVPDNTSPGLAPTNQFAYGKGLSTSDDHLIVHPNARIMRRYHRTTAVILALFFASIPQVLAQKQQPVLPPDDPEVYYSFFFFIEGFGNWLDVHAVQDPANQPKLMASAARYFKIDVQELPKLIEACRLSAANLRRVAEDARKESAVPALNGERAQARNGETVAANRQIAIPDGVSQIQQAVSAKSWINVQRAIDGAHRASIHVAN